MPKVERKHQLLFVNTGTDAAPVWKILGRGTPDSVVDVATDSTTETDILGITDNSVNKMELSQTFDPAPIQNDDTFQDELIEKILTNDTIGMMDYDVLFVKGWNPAMTAPFDAYRYPQSTFEVSSVGGSDFLTMPFTVKFGGEVRKGSVDSVKTPVTFTPAV